MAKKFLIYLSVIIITATAIYFSSAAEKNGYRERFVEFLDKASGSGDGREIRNGGSVFIDEGDNGTTGYRKGDWYEYTSDKNSYIYYRDPDRKNFYSSEDVNIDTFGSADFNFRYGKSLFTDAKYKQYDEDKPRSRIIQDGFSPEQVVKLHAEGEISDRIKVYIDHDSTRASDQNHYLMQYRAGSDDELVREVNAGEIDIKFNHSRYAVYDNTDAKGLGMDFTLAKNKFFLKAFGSITRGEAAVEYFSGNSSKGSIKLSEYQYIRRTYYQVEPFIRYDGVSVMPSSANIYSTVTITSVPASPGSYTLKPVNLNSDGFAVYLDDQNQYNNLNAVKLSIDGGYYSKLVNGSDYSINYTTGVISFIRPISENARIFVAYNRDGGSMDPCAISPGDSAHPGGIFAGKIIVFIKYGYSLNEDTVTKNFSFDAGETDNNGDGRINLDIYEIRSFYYLGSKNLLSENFILSFTKDNSEMTAAEIASLSPYSLDKTNGFLRFNLREPYRALLNSSGAGNYIYSEKYLNDTYIYSMFNISSEYCIDSRSFQLKHTNIIENSVRIKVSKKEISKSLYSVDYQSGYVTFINDSNPVIGSSTEIEIKYEYFPIGVSTNNFTGGIRGDYELNKDWKIGGSILVSKDGDGTIIPDVGSETKQTNVLEGDLSLNLPSNRLSDIFQAITGQKYTRVPAEFSAYAEYAKSFKDTNTFGKALVDNMESSDDIVVISMSEKEWILSSMPPGFGQNDRGILNYYYYRDPDSPESLKGYGFTPYTVDYSDKPGPFNIAMGHVEERVTSQDAQRSLVFDFDFTNGSCFSVVTRNLSSEAVDLSGIQYIEMWVRLDGSSTIDLYADFGVVNEDSDGDGTLDKEDTNGNGYIDATPSTGYSEDRGYTFNGNNNTVVGSGPGLSSSTKGDGVLNTEDLNGNGTLDTSESVYTVKLTDTLLSNTSGEWRKIKINIGSLTSGENNILKQTTSIRLYGKQASGNTGRLYIDSFKIVSSRWKGFELDEISVDDSSIINLSLLNTISDSDYRISSFLYEKRGIYESLYGSDSTDDINSQSETAIQFNYSIPAVNSTVSATRTFSNKLDLRFYGTMNLWINARSIDLSNTIFIRLGSSDTDYIEYRYNPVLTSSWEEISLKLSDDSSGNTEKYSVEGKPDLRRIKYIKIGVSGPGTSGSIWFDEIYVSDPEKLEGNAHWYETNLKILTPLAKTSSGVPVLSDVKIRYINRGNSSQYSSLNKTTSDISEDFNELHSSAKILPYLDLAVDYVREKSISDSIDENFSTDKRGKTVNNQLMVNSVFSSTGGSIPSIAFNYTLINNSNRKELQTSGMDYKEKADEITHTPIINWKQQFDDFLFGKLNLLINMNMVFNESIVNRDSDTVESSILSSYVDLAQTSKRQEGKTSVQMNYASGGFYFNPALELFSNEMVKWKNGDQDLGVSSEVDGGYHFPFIYSSRMKFLERNNSFTLKTGYRGPGYFAPEYNINMYYRENGFSDYSDSMILSEGYERSKSGISNLTTKIKLPLMTGKIDSLKFLKIFQVNYSRSLLLNETDIPYEGEGTDYFNESYGVSRVYSVLSPAAYNLFSYWPCYFFFGRGNFAHGRDYVHGRLNQNLSIMDELSSIEYNNSLQLEEIISSDIQLNFKNTDIMLTSSLSQTCNRTDIYGIPNQVIIAQLGISSDFDMVKILKRNFTGQSVDGGIFNAVIVSPGINYSDTMIITANTDEQDFSPELGVVFKRNRSSFKIKGAFDYRVFKNHEFIDTDLAEGDKDYIYLENMEGNNAFTEKDYGYKLNLLFETDVQWIYDYFSLAYKLTGIPVFSIEYIMQLNRYNYTETVSPEPYDLYQLKSGLTLNLHKNIKGIFSGAIALENYRNRSDESINSQVLSYELAWSFSLIF